MLDFPLSFRAARRAMLLSALALFLPVASAHAVVFDVDIGAADAVDASVGDGICDTAASTCTLRAAVQEANTTPALDTIILRTSADTELTIGPAGTASAATGDLDVSAPLTIQNEGIGSAMIDGGDVDRIFDVPDTSPGPNITLALTGVTLRDGSVQGEDGGAVRTAGTLELTGSRITSSDADGLPGFDAAGGAIAGAGSESTINVTHSRLDGNSATVAGALAVTKTADVQGSTLDGNSSRSGEGGSGGAIRNLGILNVTNSTLSGNVDNGGNGGGALINSGQASIAYSTIAENTSGLGSAIRTLGGAGQFVNVSASIVLGTCATGTLTSVAPHHNFGGGGTCGLNHASDSPSGGATLQPLEENGGPTPTHRLSPGPGVDGVDDIPAGSCVPTVDQRGGKRPMDGACDVGAFETGSLADLEVVGTVAPTTVTAGQNVTYSYGVENRAGDDATGVVLVDNLPVGVSFVSATAGCTAFEGTVTCDLGSLTLLTGKTVSIVVRADSVNSSLSNSASVTQDQNDLTPGSLTLTSAVTQPPCGTPGGDACPPPPTAPPCGTAGAAACPLPSSPPPCGTAGVAACPLPPAALALTGVKASPSRFRAASGTDFSFVLSRDAKVTFAFKGPITRKRVCKTTAGKRRCRTVTKSPSRGSFTVDGKAGANKVRFSGKLKGKALKPGGYSVTPTATVGAAKVEAKALTLTVLKPRR